MANAYREPLKDVEKQETSETHPFDVSVVDYRLIRKYLPKDVGHLLLSFFPLFLLRFSALVGVGGGCARGGLVNSENGFFGNTSINVSCLLFVKTFGPCQGLVLHPSCAWDRLVVNL